MIRASDRSKAKFMVGQVCRFAPGFAQAKKLVASGEIGKLFFVESEYAHNYAAAAGVNNWRKDPARHPFLGGACHAVDLLRWLAGDAEEVFAYSNHTTFQDWPYDDCTIACFKFKSGTLGKVFCSIGCVRPYTMRSVFYGTAGTIICDNTSSSIQVCAKGKAGDAHAYKFETVPVEIASHNVAAELNHFVRCILNDQPVETDAREATRTVVTCLAAVVSARKKKPVTINYNFV
jgi:predicted dehydrogenase